MNGRSSNYGMRNASISNLKVLKSPQEGGTKKEYDDFLEAIGNHVTMEWANGPDIAHVIKHGERPKMNEPTDMNEEDLKVKWKVRILEGKVDRYVRESVPWKTT